MHTASAQRSTSLQWHLPIDPEARVVADACDSAGILVPSIQPMTGWNRPPQLQPSEDAFSGLQILGEAKQVAGEFSAQSTAVGLGAEGSWNRRGHWHVSATRWRLPLGFPLAHEVGRHGTMDGLGQASLLSPSIASVDRLEGAVSWAVSPSVAIRVGQESHHWGQGGRSLFLDRHMAPALGARLWLDAGIVQYTHMLLRTKHLEGDTLQRGWMAAQWAEVSLGGGWSGALFGTVKWSADHDVAFQGRVEPHYLIPFGAFDPESTSSGPRTTPWSVPNSHAKPGFAEGNGSRATAKCCWMSSKLQNCSGENLGGPTSGGCWWGCLPRATPASLHGWQRPRPSGRGPTRTRPNPTRTATCTNRWGTQPAATSSKADFGLG